MVDSDDFAPMTSAYEALKNRWLGLVANAGKQMTTKRIFFSVGEPSGDLHASNLILDLDRKASRAGLQLKCFGFGGPKMAGVGCELLEDLTQHAVMFLSGVISKIAKFRQLLRDADQVFAKGEVDVVVLIDYSGFNWLVAKRAHRFGIPVVFYGIPQMWAWAPWRVRKMRKFVTLGLCKLPFEKKWLEDRHCQAEYVGHPFFDEMQRQEIDVEFVNRFRQEHLAGEDTDADLVTILPGSRTQEIRSNLPALLRTAKRVKESRPETRFVVSCLNREQQQLAESVAEEAGLAKIAMMDGNRTPELIHLAKCCLACSGSVSLELMYREKPTIIHYKLPRHLFLLQKLFLRVKYITLVNLLWSQTISRNGMSVYDPDSSKAEPVPFPEYLTTSDKSVEMSSQLIKLLENRNAFQQKVGMLQDLKRNFGHPGASEHAAGVICDRFLSPSSEHGSTDDRQPSRISVA